MESFVVNSIIASVVLTVLLNVVPRLFPNAAKNAEEKVYRRIEDTVANPDTDRPAVQVFFPWKAMLGISLLLTIVVNLVGVFAS